MQGDDAFRADLYGPTITIERRITATGHTSWCLKDHRGRKVPHSWPQSSHAMGFMACLGCPQ